LQRKARPFFFRKERPNQKALEPILSVIKTAPANKCKKQKKSILTVRSKTFSKKHWHLRINFIDLPAVYAISFITSFGAVIFFKSPISE